MNKFRSESILFGPGEKTNDSLDGSACKSCYYLEEIFHALRSENKIHLLWNLEVHSGTSREVLSWSRTSNYLFLKSHPIYKFWKSLNCLLINWDFFRACLKKIQLSGFKLRAAWADQSNLAQIDLFGAAKTLVKCCFENEDFLQLFLFTLQGWGRGWIPWIPWNCGCGFMLRYRDIFRYFSQSCQRIWGKLNSKWQLETLHQNYHEYVTVQK